MAPAGPASRRPWWRAPFARLGDWREQRALERRAIPDALWAHTLVRLPFLGHLDDAERAELRRLCSLFLDQKSFVGLGGIEVTDDLALAIAAQACLLVLHLGLHYYKGFSGVLLHEDEVVAPRSEMDEDGVVHEFDEPLTGELGPGGMIVLNLADLESYEEGLDWSAYNVVLHEFAHVIDQASGTIDGVPPLPDAAAREHWASVIDAAYDEFCTLVDDGIETVVDPYGASSVEEFFGVSVEAFFVAPAPFRDEWPELYVLMAGYFKQDPARA